MYSVKVTWPHGLKTTVFKSQSITDATIYARDRVARDPDRIQRIEIFDLTGCLRTMWDADWDYYSCLAAY